MDSHHQLRIAVIILMTLSMTDGCVFGEGCVYPCHCEGSTQCHPVNGSCPAGCDDGDPGQPEDFLLQGPWSGYGCQIGNVAYYKTATLGPSIFGGNSPFRAVDGDLDPRMAYGSCAHPYNTDRNGICWWQVDLAGDYVISIVNITNRNLNQGRLWDTYIYIRSSTTMAVENTLCYYIPRTIQNVDYIYAVCTTPIVGRYVRLERAVGSHQSYAMNICEVQVYGYPYQDCRGTEFGIACATACNCQLYCDSVSGICPENACEDGWMEDTCQTPFPVHITSVDALNITTTSLVIQFHSTILVQQTEEMEYHYSLQWREADSSTWTNETHHVQHSDNLELYEIRVEGLVSGVTYYLRLIPYRYTTTAVYRGVAVVTGPHRTISNDGGVNIAVILPVVLIVIIILAMVVVLVYFRRKRLSKRPSQNGLVENTVSSETRVNSPGCTSSEVEGSVYEDMLNTENNNILRGPDNPPLVPGVVKVKRGLHESTRATVPQGSVQYKHQIRPVVFEVEPQGNDDCAYQNQTFPVRESDENGHGDGEIPSLGTDDQVIELEESPAPLGNNDHGLGHQEIPAVEGDGHEYGNQAFVGRPITVQALPRIIGNMLKRPEAFNEEFNMLPKGQKAKWVEGAREENAPRNRFGNILAYDHSRVVLESTPQRDQKMDYINANYIQAYKDNERGYIATQGPRVSTVEDMWQMVWQTNANRIVMVTRVFEGGKVKCDQYWPGKNAMVAGPYQISLVKEDHYADYTIRALSLVHTTAGSRPVYHFHFTCWPDKTAPEMSTSLLEFRRRVRGKDDVASGPLIVHCSAGIGRTGTFLAIDYLIDQAEAEGEIDLFRYAGVMRNNRINMIQTLGQYSFVYQTLLEHVQCGTTAIDARDIKDSYSKLIHVSSVTGTSVLDEQFQLLQSLTSTGKLEGNSAALEDENFEKNRTDNVLPCNSWRPCLVTTMTGTTNYINAAYIDGYCDRQAYIVTQLPLPNTVCDIWRLLYDHHCNTIVLMHAIDAQDETTPTFWPSEASNPLVLSPLVITLNKADEQEAFYFQDFEVTRKDEPGDKSHSVRLYQYRRWEQGTDVPTSTASLLALLDHLQRWQQKSGNHPVTVQCKYGYRHSGLFLAASYMLEKLRLDQEVDVFQAVKQIRRSRPQLVTSLEQYKFLHELAVDYMSTYENYANFK